MQILEISPPKQITLSIPNDLVRKLSLTNLTLRPIYIRIFKSHNYQLTIYPQNVLLQAFQQIKIQIIVNINQNALQIPKGKIKIYFWQVKDQQNHSPQQILNDSFNQEILQRQIQINLQIDKSHQFISNHKNKKKYFQIQRILTPNLESLKPAQIQKQKTAVEKELFQICQTLGEVKSIDNLKRKYIIEYKDSLHRCEFLQIKRQIGRYLYTLSQIIQYGKKQKDFPNLICVNSQESDKKSQKKINNEKKKKIQAQKLKKEFQIIQKIKIIKAEQKKMKEAQFQNPPTMKSQQIQKEQVKNQKQNVQIQNQDKQSLITCEMQTQTKKQAKIQNQVNDQNERKQINVQKSNQIFEQQKDKIDEQANIILSQSSTMQTFRQNTQNQTIIRQQISQKIQYSKQNYQFVQNAEYLQTRQIQIYQSKVKQQKQLEGDRNQIQIDKQQYNFANKKSTALARQSFAVGTSFNRGIRRNKSEQKKYSSEYMFDQIQQINDGVNIFNNRLAQDFQNKSLSNKTVIIHYKETIIEPMKNILAIHIQKFEGQEYVYMLLRDSLIFFNICNQLEKNTIKFDPIDQQNLYLPTPLIMYKNQQIIFGNQGFIYWINLVNSQSQWKYVQRKQIYCLQTIQELNLLAVGGKNFSKFSYFGKQTSRSNIKLYSCGKKEKNHLFTYDIPGDQVGNVINMAYITTIPTNMKLLMAHTNSNDTKSQFFFFRIKAYNNIEVYGRFDIQQLGLQQIIAMKYNPLSQKVIVLQKLNEQNSALKRIKIKSNYQKVQLFTQSLKIQQGSYSGFQMGGGSSDNYSDQQQEQWYCVCDSKGKQMLTYFPSTGKTQKIQLRKGEAAGHLLLSERYLILKGKTFIRIRQKTTQVK